MDTLFLFLACIGGHLLNLYYPPFVASLIPSWTAQFGDWGDLGRRAGLGFILSMITLPFLQAYDIDTGELRYVVAAIFGWSIGGLFAPFTGCSCRYRT